MPKPPEDIFKALHELLGTEEPDEIYYLAKLMLDALQQIKNTTRGHTWQVANGVLEVVGEFKLMDQDAANSFPS